MFDETIFFFDDEFDIYRLGVFYETVAASLIFFIWMNIGIIPKKRRLDTFGAKGVNTINAARGAASVHE